MKPLEKCVCGSKMDREDGHCPDRNKNNHHLFQYKRNQNELFSFGVQLDQKSFHFNLVLFEFVFYKENIVEATFPLYQKEFTLEEILPYIEKMKLFSAFV